MREPASGVARAFPFPGHLTAQPGRRPGRRRPAPVRPNRAPPMRRNRLASLLALAWLLTAALPGLSAQAAAPRPDGESWQVGPCPGASGFEERSVSTAAAECPLAAPINPRSKGSPGARANSVRKEQMRAKPEETKGHAATHHLGYPLTNPREMGTSVALVYPASGLAHYLPYGF